MKMKKITVTGVIMAVLSAVIVGSCGFAVYKYITTDRDLIADTPDKLWEDYRYSGTNVLLTRPDNWHRFATNNILTYDDFEKIDGSTATIPITAELARQFCNASDDSIRGYVSHNKTDAAYENIIRYKTASFVLATPPSEDEYARAERKGVTLEIEPVALDGFVFITHKDNPVDSLTVQQVQDIYTGKIKNWKEVGGSNEKIRAFQRAKNSGSQTAMEELVMEGKKLEQPPVAFIMAGMSELVDAVAAEYENEPSAIGYTYYYYINNLYKNPDIKVLNINGVSPANENLVNGEYPFTTSYYAVIRSDEPEDSVYRKLYDYMLTDEGQEIIRMAGYCPINEGKNE